jgi:zona occludens toxin
MGVYLITGQPGHGKTAYALDKAFKWQKEGREIHAYGIKDLDYDKAGFKHLEDPAKWEDLPDGSVILLDECYSHFPNRNPGSKVPGHVEAVARHRHRGFDFILIAQQGLQLDPFLRGLYEEHCHVRQTSIIKSKTKVKRWNQYQSNVNGACNDVIDWVRPKYVFDYYTSTTMVTTRRQMPTWLYWLIAGVVVLLMILAFVRWHFASKIAGFEAEHAAYTGARAGQTAAAVSPAAGGPARTAIEHMTLAEYATAHLPRFATMPWTAPVYDQRAITTDPQLYCMSTSGGLDALGDYKEPSCSCITEQGTSYDLGPAECRTVARTGMPYNPYRQTAQNAPQAAPVTQPVGIDLEPPPSRATGSGGLYGSIASYGDTGVPTGRYVGESLRMR